MSDAKRSKRPSELPDEELKGKNGSTRPGPSTVSGFTLLEIVLVMTILGLLVSLALPRLPDMTGVRIEKAARKVAMIIQLTRTRAVSLRRFYRIDMDLETGSVSVSYFGPEGTYIDDEAIKSYETGEIRIIDVVTSIEGKVVEGTGRIHISPRGFTEPSLVHLRDDKGRSLTVTPSLTSGRVRILEGYADTDAI